MSWGAFEWGEVEWAELPDTGGAGPDNQTYNFGAFVDRREDQWPEWDPSRAIPVLARI